MSWSNSHLIKGELISEVRKLKESVGPDLVILGSGSIVAQLSEAALIDEFHVVGFKNGKVFLSYVASA